MIPHRVPRAIKSLLSDRLTNNNVLRGRRGMGEVGTGGKTGGNWKKQGDSREAPNPMDW